MGLLLLSLQVAGHLSTRKPGGYLAGIQVMRWEALTPHGRSPPEGRGPHHLASQCIWGGGGLGGWRGEMGSENRFVSPFPGAPGHRCTAFRGEGKQTGGPLPGEGKHWVPGHTEQQWQSRDP